MKIVRVAWLDHCEDGATWQTYEDAKQAQPVTCHTVGHLVHQDAERVVVTSTWVEDDDETVGRPLAIVASAVVGFEVLYDPDRYRTTIIDELARRVAEADT
jgi:hypothetical protein